MALVLLCLAAEPTIDPLNLDDRQALTEKLLPQVARLEVHARARPEAAFTRFVRHSYGIPWTDRRVVTLAPLVQGAQRIDVIGPTGRAPAHIVAFFLERRIAVVECALPLAGIGLKVPTKRRRPDRYEDLYALTQPESGAHLLTGSLLDAGDTPEYGGIFRISLLLQRGMPVFDGRGQVLGISRALPFDPDRQLMMPIAYIEATLARGTKAKAPKTSVPEASSNPQTRPPPPP